MVIDEPGHQLSVQIDHLGAQSGERAPAKTRRTLSAAFGYDGFGQGNRIALCARCR
jgi:hypothetical protein